MTGIILDQPRDAAPTFAEPGDALGAADTMKALFRAPIDPLVNPQPYADLIRASERVTRFTGNIASESAAREEAYDQRIAVIKSLTGAQLENPERDGYQQVAKGMIRDQVQAGLRSGTNPDIQGGIPALQKQLFDQEVAKLQQSHPELQWDTTIDEDAQKIARESIQGFQEARRAPGLNPYVAAIDTFAGGLIGSRRDPIFLGSLLAGPTSSTGRFLLGRVVSGALRAGFYNAGISALEQPAVQEWRAKIGLESGVTPALEDVGQAFLFGAIPGAVIHGGIETVRAVRVCRLLAGAPEPGDVDAALQAVPGVAERDVAAIRAGEDSVAADRATMTVPRPKDVPPDLHDDMAAAALKRADQPNAPSPEAVEAVQNIPRDQRDPDLADVRDRVEQAAPRSEAEAAQMADQAFDDLGRAHGMGGLRENMARGDAERSVPPPAPPEPGAATAPAPRPRGDILDKVPFVDDSGAPKMLTAKAAAAIGERENTLSMLVKSCK